MKPVGRRVSGARAQREGQTFELRFQIAAVRQDVAITRIPDSCKRVGPHKLIQIKSPFDFVLSYKGRSAMIDTKSCKGSFPHSHIDESQIRTMLSHEHAGVRAGYVIYLRSKGITLFIHATSLVDRLKVRGSIDETTLAGVTILGTENQILPRTIFEHPL